jgi:hypothetical protein
MSNTCRNTITIVGLTETPEAFVKTLSKVMFRIDRDGMESAEWCEDKSTDGKTWYTSLTDTFLRDGAVRDFILYVKDPYSQLGITAPQ